MTRQRVGAVERLDARIVPKQPDGRIAHQAYSRAADLYRQLKSDKDVQELTALMQKAAPPK